MLIMAFSIALLLSCARSSCVIDSTSTSIASNQSTGETRVGEPQQRKNIGTAFVKNSSFIHYEIVTNLNANGKFLLKRHLIYSYSCS